MKGIHNNPDYILDKAIDAVRADQADPEAEQAATTNAWQRISQAIGVEATLAPLNRIEGCADVLRLLPDYEAHKLSAARANWPGRKAKHAPERLAIAPTTR